MSGIKPSLFSVRKKEKKKKKKAKVCQDESVSRPRLRRDGVGVLGRKSLLDPGRLDCQNTTLRRHKLTRAGTDTHPGSM